nr:DUF2116 family Zn-ribbon domain-containing protein [Candidatus Sigynarchaeota archaeon]
MTEVKGPVKEEVKLKPTKKDKEAEKAAADQAKNDLIDQRTEDWRNKAARGYQEHQHCSICGRAIHLGKKYCSMECKNKYEGVAKKQKKNQNLQCIIMSAVMPVIMIIMLTMSGGH